MLQKFPLYVVATLIFLSGATCNVGCNALQPNGFPREMGEAAKAIVGTAATQAVFEQIAANVDGQAIEPGMEAYGGVIYFGGAKLRGFSGQIGLRAQGKGRGTPTTAEELKGVNDVVHNPDAADLIKEAAQKPKE